MLINPSPNLNADETISQYFKVIQEWEKVVHIGQTDVILGDYSSASGTPHVGNVWWHSCGSIQGMTGNTAAEGAVIKLMMGFNIDYFRPAAGFTLCEMLGSKERHEWSNDMVTWFTPAYFSRHFRGGSAVNWPLDNVAGDNRGYLPFWGGTSHHQPSGCCHYDNSSNSPGWGKMFDMFVQVNNVVVQCGANHHLVGDQCVANRKSCYQIYAADNTLSDGMYNVCPQLPPVCTGTLLTA